ncbi:MAG: OmpA family protein [bacterium]
MATETDVAVLEKPEHQSMFAASDLFEDDDHMQHPRHPWPTWIVTFADMVTLLMAFFVLLLSFSDLDPTRFRDVSGSLQKSLGSDMAPPVVVAPPTDTQLAAGGPSINGGPATEAGPFSEQLAKDLGKLEKELSTDLVGKKIQLHAENGRLVLQLPERGKGVLPQELIDLYARIADAQAQVESVVEVREGIETADRMAETARQLDKLREALKTEIVKGQAQVERDGERIVIRLVVQGSFYSGSADLATEFMPVLKKIGKTITEAGGRIIIEGHTDDVPLSGHNRYRSNWDLSGARAGAVADYLSEHANGPRERLMVRGMADTKPVSANDTREGRAKNRRIEILVDAFGS